MFFNSHTIHDFLYFATLPAGIILLGSFLNIGFRWAASLIRWRLPGSAESSNVPFILILLLLGVLWGVLMQGSLYLNFLLVIGGLVYFFIPYLCLVTACALCKRLLNQKIVKCLSVAVLIGCATSTSLLLSMVVSGGIHGLKIQTVHRFVARAVPILDDIKSRTGSYPLTLPVSSLGKPPSFFRDFGAYSSNGSEFHFEYIDEPAGWAGGRDHYEFDSSNREWKNE